ncbi:hypothetical protein QVD17_18454 [Tagetes erecta]|uniref:Uncharacterized protein n=1 Tax=Tagetes erecta TaxID=13708 RepID=A0AAD8KI42_TARER|nr:hypothetical protein QVD17_18454 [Tagetes erecta]
MCLSIQLGRPNVEGPSCVESAINIIGDVVETGKPHQHHLQPGQNFLLQWGAFSYYSLMQSSYIGSSTMKIAASRENAVGEGVMHIFPLCNLPFESG